MFVFHQEHLDSRIGAMKLIGSGLSDYEIARRTGTSRSSVQRWRKHGMPTPAPSAMSARLATGESIEL
jgi:transposase